MCGACDGQRAVSPTGSPPLLPGGPVVILHACPGPSCFGPGLNIFNGPLRFSNLLPSNGIAGSAIATSQSASGDAKSDNN
jgi:hypothetical protein